METAKPTRGARSSCGPRSDFGCSHFCPASLSQNLVPIWHILKIGIRLRNDGERPCSGTPCPLSSTATGMNPAEWLGVCHHKPCSTNQLLAAQVPKTPRIQSRGA